MYTRITSAIKTVVPESSQEMILKYFICKDMAKDIYGVEIEKYHIMPDGNEEFIESDSVDNITDRPEKVTAFFELLCDGYVTPLSLASVIDDYSDWLLG